jgi:hypothetical protein
VRFASTLNIKEITELTEPLQDSISGGFNFDLHLFMNRSLPYWERKVLEGQNNIVNESINKKYDDMYNKLSVMQLLTQCDDKEDDDEEQEADDDEDQEVKDYIEEYELFKPICTVTQW